MRRFLLVALLAATAAAQVVDENVDNYQHELDDNYMPVFTEKQLENPVIVPLDITSGIHEETYNAKSFMSKDGKIMSTVFHAPSDALFKAINHGVTTIFNPETFLSYKVIVDYVDKEAYYVRIFGIVKRGVYGVRYLINTNDGFVKVSRAEYNRHRAQYSTPYTLDLCAQKSELLEKNIVEEHPESPQEFTSYQPQFNYHINEVVAGPVKLCEFDPAKAGTGMKVMTYNFDGKKYCVVQAVNIDGGMEEHVFVETEEGFTRISDRQRDGFFTPASEETTTSSEETDEDGCGATDDQPDQEGVINYTQLTPPSQHISKMFSQLQFLKVNIRQSPRENGPWTRTTYQNGNGCHETMITAQQGYVIYRLVDNSRLIWERPGLALTNATLMNNLNGEEFLQLEVLAEDGSSFNYYFSKYDDKWHPITRERARELANPNKIGTVEEKIHLKCPDLSQHDLDRLKCTTSLPFDTTIDCHYAWLTDSVSEGAMLTRKLCTAMDEYYSFNSFITARDVIMDLKDQYRSTQAIHYKAVGLELLGFNAFDLNTGRCSLQFYLRRENRWIRIDQAVFYQRINDVLEFIFLKRRQAANGTDLSDDAVLNDEMANYVLSAMHTFQHRDIDTDLPMKHEYDSHTGGYNVGKNLPHDRECSGSTECHCPCKCKCTCNQTAAEKNAALEHISLELHCKQDNRYKIHAVTGRDGSTRINFKPSEGYKFAEITEGGILIFKNPEFNITDAIIDISTDGQYFLQVLGFDHKGEQHIYYLYKAKKAHTFTEVCRRTYVSMRYRTMTRTAVNVNSHNTGNPNLIRFRSRHYGKVQSFVPRYNCIIDRVHHENTTIWTYDELNPEVILRVVTFVRDNIRGVLLQLIDYESREVDRLYLNTNPQTNEYVPFLHKGEMFSLFKTYLLNRRTGLPGFRTYRENDIDWTREILPGSHDHNRIHSKRYIAPSAYDVSEYLLRKEEEEETCPCKEKEAELARRKAREDLNGMSAEEVAKKAAIEAKHVHMQNVKDNSYYSGVPLTLSNVVHKEGVVWDSNGTGEVCLDYRKFDKGQYRLVECDIMTPDGRVEVRYFMNTHNGRGHYKEVELCRVGMDV
ncbi:spherical body protein 3 [Babesia bovis T2Bo]|uniref:Spherical body protein 3 n=1 Tax=Babesia bovis TaxID=5865 RepID=A7AWS4_BABBO|nr:spherical body protein 3 [Babesia bovis T2Bo]EDO05502.1 spherical body protein 3 [Babesia bovis T2Bo]|eukprot:XP_001609070.1 spherical body protein 3 [Babesia bovis T2Bo]